jgi:3-hydroxybutyryl-CoA dehydrogenase
MTQRVVVIGAGTMGAGIAYVFALHGYHVEVVDPMIGSRDACAKTIEHVAGRAVEQHRISESEGRSVVGRVSFHESVSHVERHPNLAVEAVPEEMSLKRLVLREAEELQPGLLASNTSSISIDALARDLQRPAEFLGMHFFNPVWSNALVEIVTGGATSQESLALARDTVTAIGKEAVVVRDSPGFASSRLGVMLGLEAIRMVEEGVASPEDIDKAMELGYRHPMGPLRLTDLVGLDVRLGIARNLAEAYGERFAPPALLIDKVARGELGKKSGRGFFNW